MPTITLPIPLTAASAVFLQNEDHPDTTSICSAALPAKLYTKETFLGLLCWGRTRPGTLQKVQISPFRTQARLQNPHSYTCCCYLRALHQVNSDTFLLRSHVKGSAKSSSERDWRPGLQKVLPCPDQQQDGVCRFPTRYRRQLFGECESSKRCCRASKLVQNPRAVSSRTALPCLPSSDVCPPISAACCHHWNPSCTLFCLSHQPMTGQGNMQRGNTKQDITGIS